MIFEVDYELDKLWIKFQLSELPMALGVKVYTPERPRRPLALGAFGFRGLSVHTWAATTVFGFRG